MSANPAKSLQIASLTGRTIDVAGGAPQYLSVSSSRAALLKSRSRSSLPALISARISAAGLLRGQRAFLERQVEPAPDVDQGLSKRVDQAVVVIGARRDPQSLGALRHGRIVDRLDVDAVIGKQQIARRLAQLRIADMDRHDVGWARHHRKPCR